MAAVNPTSVGDAPHIPVLPTGTGNIYAVEMRCDEATPLFGIVRPRNFRICIDRRRAAVRTPTLRVVLVRPAVRALPPVGRPLANHGVIGLKHGEAADDPQPFVLTVTPQYVAQQTSKAQPISGLDLQAI
jgi:hypothetical protein